MGLLDRMEDVFEERSRRVASGNQVLPSDERRGPQGLGRHGAIAFANKVPVVEMAAGGHAVHAMES